MKKKVNPRLGLLCLACLLLCTASCKSIIEEDIDDKKVTINAPNSSVLQNYNQLFWWEVLEGATKYQVQIARPRFDAMQELILDTLVTGNKLTFTLGPDDYEWRVRGINGNYESTYNGSQFTILEAPLDQQRILLTSPEDDEEKRSKPVPLTWQALKVNGIKYKVQVSTDSGFETIIMEKEVSTAYSSAIIPAEEADYYWRVRGFKGQDSTAWSDERNFVYDITAPGEVTTPSPANNQEVTFGSTGKLSWKAVDGANQYKVWIKIGSDAKKLSTVSTNSFSYVGRTDVTVTWEVQAIDKAGNPGPISSWSFYIKP